MMTALLLYLRQRLTQADAQGERAVVALAEMEEYLRVFERTDSVDRARYDPTRLAVGLLSAIARVHPDSLVINGPSLAQRAGSDRLKSALDAHVAPDSIWADWRSGIDAFLTERREYLLYR